MKKSERTGSYSPFAIESTEGSDGSVSALSRAFAWFGRIYGTARLSPSNRQRFVIHSLCAASMQARPPVFIYT